MDIAKFRVELSNLVDRALSAGECGTREMSNLIQQHNETTLKKRRDQNNKKNISLLVQTIRDIVPADDRLAVAKAQKAIDIALGVRNLPSED